MSVHKCDLCKQPWGKTAEFCKCKFPTAQAFRCRICGRATKTQDAAFRHIVDRHPAAAKLAVQRLRETQKAKAA